MGKARLAVDIGGTFTDLALEWDGKREIVKVLKDAKMKKVQAAIQGDQLRISSPSKDDLQAAMQLLRGHDFGIALQFGNYRS